MATLTIRNIDPALKTEAQKIFKLHGLTTQATVQAFFRKVVSDHGKEEDSCFCRELEINEGTRHVLEETDKEENLTSFASAEEMFEHLRAQCAK